MRLGPPPEVEEEPGQFWKDFIRDTAPVFRKPTIEQLTEFIEPTWRALCDGARYVDDRLREIFDEVSARRDRRGQRPLLPRHPPLRAPVGAHRLVQPARGEGLRDPAGLLRLPGGDRTGWDGVPTEYARAIADLHGEFSAFCEERGAGRSPRRASSSTSPTG